MKFSMTAPSRREGREGSWTFSGKKGRIVTTVFEYMVSRAEWRRIGEKGP